MKFAKHFYLCVFLCLPLCIAVGCGGGVSEGVSDGPDEPEPVLTEEEMATEEADIRADRQQ